MWVIRALPLSVSPYVSELTYYATEKIAEGCIIKIQIRGKDEYGLVTHTSPLEEEKQTLKGSSFTLKKLSRPDPAPLVRRGFLRACFEAAMYEAVSPSALIATLIPTAILKKRASLPPCTDEEKESSVAYEPLIFAEPRHERIREYRKLARESLARGLSILIICPTVVETKRLAEELSHGIEDYVECFHGALSEKRMVDVWKHSLETKQPRVIVGTLLALSIPRMDIGTIILEREGARSYERDEKPYAHGARVAEWIAKTLRVRFILSGTVPSVTLAHRKLRGDVQDYGLFSGRITGAAPDVVDMRTFTKEKGGWAPLSPLALSTIRQMRTDKQRVLIIAARRGLAPLTVCDDCGTALTCAVCSSHLVLHKDDTPKFLCHHCGTEESASVRCIKCGGWRLTTLGVSVDRILEALAPEFKEEILVATADSGTRNDIEKIVGQFKGEGSGILVGTELLVPYIPDHLPCVVVASVDSFLGIPEYTSTERVFTLLCELRSRSEQCFILQTRAPEHRAIRAAVDGMLLPFYKDELRDREKFVYPPSATLLRFTVTGKQETVLSHTRELMAALEKFSPQLLPSRSAKRGQSDMRLLIRLGEGAWIDGKLLRFIKMLPPTITVRVNPLSLLTD